MLLFDQDQIAKLKEVNKSFLESLLQTDPINDVEARDLNDMFDQRMDRDPNHASDKGHHFFSRESIQLIVNQPGIQEVIFVYLADQQGSSLRVAVVGKNKNYIPDYIYESTKDSAHGNRQLDLDNDIIPGMKNYRNRMSTSFTPPLPAFDPKRDAGVIHEPRKLNIWLKTLKEDPLSHKKIARVYLGVYEDDFQVVMLVDNTKEKLGSVRFPDPQYALDKGTGCCP